MGARIKRLHHKKGHLKHVLDRVGGKAGRDEGLEVMECKEARKDRERIQDAQARKDREEIQDARVGEEGQRRDTGCLGRQGRTGKRYRMPV